MYHIKIDETECMMCLSCIDICPMRVYTYDGEKLIIKEESCVGCEACSSSCPVGAIEVS